MSDTVQVIEDLKRRFGVRTDAELADALRMGRSTVTNWRRRDSVPARYKELDAPLTAVEHNVLVMVAERLRALSEEIETLIQKSGTEQ